MKYLLIVLVFLPTLAFSSDSKEYSFLTDLLLPILAIIVSVIVLLITYANNQRINFNNKFNLFMEQHDRLHSILEGCINNDVNEYNSIVTELDCENSIKKLFRHEKYSPYMRFLYHVLKFIDKETPILNIRFFLRRTKAKKDYSSVIRSLISNKVMILVMINSLNKEFKYYRELLNKFSFFEHVSLSYLYENSNYSRTYHCFLSNGLFDGNVRPFVFDYIKSKALGKEIKNDYYFEMKKFWSMYIDVSRRDNDYYNDLILKSIYSEIKFGIEKLAKIAIDDIRESNVVTNESYRIIASVSHDDESGGAKYCDDFISKPYFYFSEIASKSDDHCEFLNELRCEFEKFISSGKYISPRISIVAICKNDVDPLGYNHNIDGYIGVDVFYKYIINQRKIDYVNCVTEKEILLNCVDIIGKKMNPANLDIFNRPVHILNKVK
ncbi:hypothetical protein CYG68_12220 [Morganella morganii]|uniref:Phage abortive infection protein n=1 Tax=Morganella morganii TaxID=582 RepID=A0A8I0U4K9_MORMO|nr:putative phage abortive infection protein [Morganella morganii]MBE8613165.1 hypothetical protein [Morganella morganii]